MIVDLEQLVQLINVLVKQDHRARTTLVDHIFIDHFLFLHNFYGIFSIAVTFLAAKKHLPENEQQDLNIL